MNTAENEFLTCDGGFVAEESEVVVLDRALAISGAFGLRNLLGLLFERSLPLLSL